MFLLIVTRPFFLLIKDFFPLEQNGYGCCETCFGDKNYAGIGLQPCLVLCRTQAEMKIIRRVPLWERSDVLTGRLVWKLRLSCLRSIAHTKEKYKNDWVTSFRKEQMWTVCLPASHESCEWKAAFVLGMPKLLIDLFWIPVVITWLVFKSNVMFGPSLEKSLSSSSVASSLTWRLPVHHNRKPCWPRTLQTSSTAPKVSPVPF